MVSLSFSLSLLFLSSALIKNVFEAPLENNWSLVIQEIQPRHSALISEMFSACAWAEIKTCNLRQMTEYLKGGIKFQCLTKAWTHTERICTKHLNNCLDTCRKMNQFHTNMFDFTRSTRQPNNLVSSFVVHLLSFPCFYVFFTDTTDNTSVKSCRLVP